MGAKKRIRPVKPIEVPAKKKKKRPFVEGDYVVNVEDPSFIIKVVKTEKEKESFEGIIIESDKRVVGTFEMFWLKSRFTIIDNYKE